MALESVGKVREIEQQIVPIRNTANDLVIQNSNDYESGAGLLLDIKRGRKTIDEFMDPIVKANFEAHKTSVAQKRKLTDPLDSAERIVKAKMVMYQAEQDRIASRKEEELRAQLRKKAEDEQLALAEALDRDGQKEEAEMVLQETVQVAPVVVAPEVPRVSGVSFREVWKFRIVNKDQIPRDYLMPDETKLGQYARMQKDGAKMSGVEFYMEKTISASGR